MAKRKDREQFTIYLSSELAAMIEALEEVWEHPNRASFFERAIKNQVGVEIVGNRELQIRIARALDAHITALREL